MNLTTRLLHSYQVARTGVYFLESLPLALATRFITHRHLAQPTDEEIRDLLKQALDLHARDAENLAQGLYDWRAMDIERPWPHFRSFLGVMKDGVNRFRRIQKGDAKSFEGEARELAEELPEYYRRNFHFQTDGYLSDASALRYDHQVEVLFVGTAGAMRRAILPILRKARQGRWLELGSGCGSATRPVLATFRKTRVTALDLSSPYLKVARERLKAYHRVDFVQGDAASLSYKDESFEAIYSVYLMHELPRAEREKVVKESWRALKPGGILLFADSLQKDDDAASNERLDLFPQTFHEPFFKDYTLDPLEDLLHRLTGQPVQSDRALFTKIVWVQKPE